MTRWLVLCGVCLWAGSTLLLSRLRWFRVPPLVERLRPYTPTGMQGRPRAGLMSADSFVEVVGPLVGAVGDRVARLLGISEDLSARLARSGSALDANSFRLRQAGWAGASCIAASLVAVAAGLGAPMATGLVLGAPLLAVLLVEQRVTDQAQQWQHRLLVELPVVIEQLAMLLSSGFSLGSAIGRLGQRSRGACAAEFRLVSARIAQGVPEIEALREWAVRCDVPAVDRLVGVLALNWEASDLGSLIASEARAVRREVHRRELEEIEERSQKVWIPVTVATLLPGVIFMSVPFIDAMSRLTGR